MAGADHPCYHASLGVTNPAERPAAEAEEDGGAAYGNPIPS